MELFDLIFVFDDDEGFVIGSAFYFEGPEFHIFLYDGVVEFSADESFGVEDGVDGVFGGLIFGCVSDESFGFCESDIGWGGSVSLIVGDDFNSFVLPDAYAGVGGSEIDSNGSALGFLGVSHDF